MSKDPKSWSEEEKRLVTRIASNWGDTKKPEQENYTFFQGPTPKTGNQENLPSFFSTEARAEMTEIPQQLFLFGGVLAVGVTALTVFLVTS